MRRVNFIATADGYLNLGPRRVRCALGKAGVTPAAAKREGDLASPIGVWPIRRVLYRPDRGAAPETALPVQALSADDGWCDAPGDPQYNLQVKRPYRASNEELWRADHLYDLLVVIGFNDDPVVRGKGSAIFLHVARPGYGPTAGCVAIAMADWHELLPLLAPGDTITIKT